MHLKSKEQLQAAAKRAAEIAAEGRRVIDEECTRHEVAIAVRQAELTAIAHAQRSDLEKEIERMNAEEKPVAKPKAKRTGK